MARDGVELLNQIGLMIGKFYFFRFRDFEINILCTKDKVKREWHTQGFFQILFFNQ